MPSKHHIIRLAITVLLTLSMHALAAASALKDYQTTMGEMVADLSRHQDKIFNRTLDTDTILDTSFDGLMLDSAWEDDMRGSLKEAIETRLGQKIINDMPDDAYVKMLRMKAKGDVVLALIRVDYGDFGTGYLDLHLKRHADDTVRIVDWYDYSTGQLYTQSLRQIIAMMSPSPTVLGKVFDVVSKRKESINAVVRVFSLYGKQKYPETVQAFLALDEELRRSRMLNVVAVQAANMSQNDELYLKALANLERYFRTDPSLTFLLIDYYYLKGRYDRVLAALEQVEASFGVKDASLNVLKASALLEQEKYTPAASEAQHAIDMEPTYEGGYWALLRAQVQSKQYPQAIKVAKVLEEEFSYDMGASSLGADELYAAFVASEDYRHWRNTD